MDPKEKIEEAVPEAAPEVTPEVAAETPAEPEVKPPHKYADRLSKAYPDRKFEKDEDYDAAMDEHLDGLEGYKEKGQMANQKLIALFDAEPQVGDVVRDMINGATFREALARHISPDDLTAIEGDPDFDGWNKNKTAREEAAGKRQKTEEEFENNLNVSKEDVAKFAEENNLDEAKVGELIDKIDAMLMDFQAGKITKEHLSAMNKALSYDSAVADAATTGEISGRNQNIVASKEAAPKMGDGLPKLASGSEAPPAEKAAPDYFSDLASRTRRRQVL